MEYKQYSEILKDKRVVLVGPSWHTKGSKQGKKIDSYDIVVRMNLGYRIPNKIKNDIGTRMDILYCSLSDYYFKYGYFTKKILKKMAKKTKCISLTHCKIHKKCLRDLDNINKNINIPIYIVDNKTYNFLKSKINKKVSCGIVTIFDLLRYGIKELYITGFTFYDTKVIGKRRIYYSNYNKNGIKYSKRPFGSHDMSAELSMFKKCYDKDERIKCDNVLMDIIKQGKICIKNKKKKNE